jgi:hypothetical protein
MNRTLAHGEIVVVMKIYHNDLHKLCMDLVVTFVDNRIGGNKLSLNFNLE